MGGGKGLHYEQQPNHDCSIIQSIRMYPAALFFAALFCIIVSVGRYLAALSSLSHKFSWGPHFQALREELDFLNKYSASSCFAFSTPPESHGFGFVWTFTLSQAGHRLSWLFAVYCWCCKWRWTQISRLHGLRQGVPPTHLRRGGQRPRKLKSYRWQHLQPPRLLASGAG